MKEPRNRVKKNCFGAINFKQKNELLFFRLSKTLEEEFDSFLEKKGLNDVGVVEDPDSDEEYQMETNYKVVGTGKSYLCIWI